MNKMKKIYYKPQTHNYIVRVESLLNADSPGFQSGDDMEAKKVEKFEDDKYDPLPSHNTLWDDTEE